MNQTEYIHKISHKIDREYLLPINPIKGSVIVETRKVKDIGLIIKNHLHFMPAYYGLTVFHSNMNSEFIKNELNDIVGVNYANTGETHLSATAYNYMLTSEWFWKLIPYQKTLIFQADSLLLRTGVDLFEGYDYCGACWDHMGKQVGNGGLSLRTNELMKQIIKKFQYNPNHHGNEDVYFSKNIESFGGIKPSCEVANHFAVETMYYDRPIGLHAAWKFLSKNQMDTIYTNSIKEL